MGVISCFAVVYGSMSEIDTVCYQLGFIFEQVVESSFVLQGLIVLADSFLMSLPVIKGEDPNLLAISSAAVSFISLILGESGWCPYPYCARMSYYAICFPRIPLRMHTLAYLFCNFTGRRHSRVALLKIYLILSIVALLLSVACAVQSDLLLEVTSLDLMK